MKKLLLFFSIINVYCLFSNVPIDELRMLSNTLLSLEQKITKKPSKQAQEEIENIQFVTDITGVKAMIAVSQLKDDLGKHGITLKSVAENKLMHNATIGVRIEYVTGRFMGETTLRDYKEEEFANIANLFYLYIVVDPGIATPEIEDPVHGVFAYPIKAVIRPDEFEITSEGKAMIKKVADKILSIKL